MGQVVEVWRLNRKDGRERRPNIRNVVLLSELSVETKITGEVTAIHHYSLQTYLTQ